MSAVSWPQESGAGRLDCSGAQHPAELPRLSTPGCCPTAPTVAPPAELPPFPFEWGPCGPRQLYLPPRSSLGFCGHHIPVHIVGLPAVLVRAPCPGGRRFSQDLLCGWTDQWAGGQTDDSHGHTQERLPWPVCLSRLWDLPETCPTPGAGKCDPIPAAGRPPAQEDLPSGALFKASAAADAPEASLWNQLDWLRGSLPRAGPSPATSPTSPSRPGPSEPAEGAHLGAPCFPTTYPRPSWTPATAGWMPSSDSPQTPHRLQGERQEKGWQRGSHRGSPQASRVPWPPERRPGPRAGRPLGDEGIPQCVPTEAHDSWGPIPGHEAMLYPKAPRHR